MNWLNLIMSGVAALVGGFAGGWIVAFRLGRALQKIEDDVAANTRRLARGNGPVGDVPVLKARVEVVIGELREIKAELREDRQRFVTHTECDRRHENDAA